MADHEDGAGIVLQQLFEQLQRLDVEVVGRLVEHQHIGRLGEQTRQQQAVALAPRQRAHRRVGPRRREQEVAQIAHDMLARAADLDPLAARADGVGQRGVEVERVAHLVEVGHLQLRALAHRAGVRRDLAQDELEQRGLAGAVRADQADLVAAQDGGGEVAHDGAGAVGLGHALEFGHDLAAAAAGVELQAHLADDVAARGALLAQRHQAVDAADAAGAARLHALADPDLLLRQQLVEARIGQRLVLELARLGRLVGAEAAGVAAQLAAVQFEDAGRDRVEEGAVVRDQDDRAGEARQQVLQPDDRLQVEVVGRLVEQQHIGRGRQRLRQRHALLQPAGKLVDHPVGRQLQALERLGDTLLPGPAAQRLDAALQRIQILAGRMRLVALAQRLGLGHADAHRLEHRRARRELRLLRDVMAPQALLELQQPVVRALQPGEDLQQRGLAGAIAADQAEALARLERHRRVVEQRDMPVGETGVLEGEKGHGRVREGNRTLSPPGPGSPAVPDFSRLLRCCRSASIHWFAPAPEREAFHDPPSACRPGDLI